MNIRVKRLISLFFAMILITSIIVPVYANPLPGTFSGPERQVLQQYANDTWKSFVAMTYPSGLPSDNISADGTLAQYTSPTNIGAYIWSTLAARLVRRSQNAN